MWVESLMLIVLVISRGRTETFAYDGDKEADQETVEDKRGTSTRRLVMQSKLKDEEISCSKSISNPKSKRNYIS